MFGSVTKKVAWMARATATFVGLAIMLALVLGVATTALAGTGVGARFDLGKINTVDAVSKVVGSVAGPSLQIDNNGAGASATALDLQVQPGKAPMKVNSTAKVAKLNSDKVDGKSANDLTRVAFAQNASRRIEKDTTLEASISAPTAGFLLINATTTVTRSDSNVIGFITVDGNFDDPSLKDISLEGSGIFATETVVPVESGEHTVSFKAVTSRDDTAYEGTTLSALFVPFDGSGASPSSAAISADRESRR